jgi:urease accessory protein
MALKAKVHIETAWRNNRTVLQKTFSHSPFKIADITENKQQKELQLMIMSSSPGVLDEDDYQFEIDVAKDCRLTLQTQSYQRIFQMKKGASQTMIIRLAEGAKLKYLPHPVVPHKASVFTSINKIYMADDASLVWGEVIACGRYRNDEIFQFTSYRSVTEIFRNGKLVVKENLLLAPQQTRLEALGQLEGYTHQATFIFMDDTTPIENMVNMLAEELAAVTNITFGITLLPVNGFLVRLLGYGAEQLFLVLHRLSIVTEFTSPQQIVKPLEYV